MVAAGTSRGAYLAGFLSSPHPRSRNNKKGLARSHERGRDQKARAALSVPQEPFLVEPAWRAVVEKEQGAPAGEDGGEDRREETDIC